MSENILVNRVAESGIITINLEHWFPKEEIVFFDLKQFLFMELILKEKDYRAALKEVDWIVYKNKIVLVGCTADAIIPVWAYMLATTYLYDVAADISQTNSSDTYLSNYFDNVIDKIIIEQYSEKRVVIKGCSDKPVPVSAYLKISQKLLPVVQSLMYGEPCSTVPLFKRPRKINIE
jgi:hypothetical protein